MKLKDHNCNFSELLTVHRYSCSSIRNIFQKKKFNNRFSYFYLVEKKKRDLPIYIDIQIL